MINASLVCSLLYNAIETGTDVPSKVSATALESHGALRYNKAINSFQWFFLSTFYRLKPLLNYKIPRIYPCKTFSIAKPRAWQEPNAW
jgi:hypothetical protein